MRRSTANRSWRSHSPPRDGDYGLSGRLAPSPFLKGKLQRLTEPTIAVSGHGRLADRQLDGRLSIASKALNLVAAGRLDLATSAFHGLALDARLLHPPALFPNMTGRDVHLHVVFDGGFRDPAFRYRLASPHIAFDTTGFDNVVAAGAGRMGRLPIAVPITLSAKQVTGIGAVAGGILANLTVKGTLAVDAKALTAPAWLSPPTS